MSMATEIEQEELVAQALDVWAPSYPRRVGRTQQWARSAGQAIQYLLSAQRSGESPYLSVYSFPRGHTKDNNIPKIDTLFIDFDFESGDYEPGSGDVDAWRRDISQLITRAGLVAEVISEQGAGPWRAALSGHKGIHLFLDFETLGADLGSFRQYVNGLNEYADDMVQMLVEETGLQSLERYVDVTSSDLGRLCRAPNTLHEGATASFGEERYCVPVTIEEVVGLTPDKYIELTSAPRPVETQRNPSAKAGDIIEHYVASAGQGSAATGSYGSTVEWDRIDDYQEQSNDNITLGDIKFLTSDRPCVWRYYERDDKYRHGYQSHYMEMFCMRELVEHNVPIEVMKDFFDSAPEYNERYTEQRIKEIIARDYKRFRVDSILKNAREFCGYDDCGVCQRRLQEMNTTHD